MPRLGDQLAKKRGKLPRESDLEKFFDFALRAFAPEIPTPVKEFVAIPGRKYRFDRAWPDRMLLIEVNGGTWANAGGETGSHGRGSGIDRDYWKADEAVALGYRVMMFSRSMLRRDPRQCVELVKRALSTDPESVESHVKRDA